MTGKNSSISNHVPICLRGISSYYFYPFAGKHRSLPVIKSSTCRHSNRVTAIRWIDAEPGILRSMGRGTHAQWHLLPRTAALGRIPPLFWGYTWVTFSLQSQSETNLAQLSQRSSQLGLKWGAIHISII